MLFNSYEFIFLFVPVALLGYWSAARWFGASSALWWLVAASLFFYGWWNPVYLPLLLASVGGNYALGRRLSRRGRGTRMLLAIGVAANLGALGYFKYTNFLLGTVDAIAGTTLNPAPIVLPLAISFFTFQQIAYLVDSYRGLTREYSFGRYTLFVVFFPQLIAGPIVHHGEMLPQFARRERMAPRTLNLLVGLSIFCVGLFKKIVLADGIAVHADAIFAAAARGETLDFFLGWTGALCYTMQLYFDFSAYSDMAVGLARLFGIRLPINFNSPYKARSIVDFWRRWHMTLSRFLRDYLYIALGGNRRGAARRYLNLFLTMLLGGIWHGAGWTFVLWGAWHGLMLIVNHAWTALRRRAGWDRDLAVWPVFAWLLTFVGVVAGWVLFRADSVDTALRMLAAMAGANGATLPLHWRTALQPLVGLLEAMGVGFANATLMLTYAPLLWIIALGAIATFAPNVYQIFAHYRPVLRADAPAAVKRLSWRPTWPWTLALAALAALALLNLSNISPFLYFQF
ncbi:MBOAT family O-acyltransferase [Sinimarinibacterium thermocellulolyticum]|uniref:Probable alginate O-acetylase n=1 Tax=Sinimarinibacterium thermocellulolyticum TaxID=3170016 RepID=A0ABV2A9K4_9GAMM